MPEPLVSSADPATWVFAVDREIKGSVPEQAVVLSAVSGATCGLELTGTGPFVVFAGDAGTHLTAGLCQGTSELTPALQRDLDSLTGAGGTVVPGHGPLPADEGWWPTPAFLAGAVGLLVLLPLVWHVLRGTR